MTTSTKVFFRNRQDAGKQIGRRLRQEWLPDALLVGLPRGGVPVARAAAEELRAPWSSLLVRKLYAAEDPEFALGALAEGGEPLWSKEDIPNREEIVARAEKELQDQAERLQHYHLPKVSGRPAIVIDDGLATGWTARAAARRLRELHASEVWGAFPVGPPETAEALREDFDQVICLHCPERFRFVGQFYEDFSPEEI